MFTKIKKSIDNKIGIKPCYGLLNGPATHIGVH